MADADDDFAIGSLAGGRLLRLLDSLHHAILLFFLLPRIQIFAVLFCLAANLMGVDVEDFELRGLGLFDAAAFVQSLVNFSLVEGVVFANGIHLRLMVAHLLHERGHVGKRGVSWNRRL